MIGTQAVATSQPDGYTIGVVDTALHHQSRSVRIAAAL